MLETERGNTGSHCMENSFWKSLWTCRTIGSMMHGIHVAFKNGNETKRSLCNVPRHDAVNNAFKTILSPEAIKRTLVFMWSIPYFCLTLPEFAFPQHISTQVSNLKFNENLFTERSVRVREQTARLEEASKQTWTAEYVNVKRNETGIFLDDYYSQPGVSFI
jgi:hypothetical protein